MRAGLRGLLYAGVAALGMFLPSSLAPGQPEGLENKIAIKENLDLPFDARGESEDEEVPPEIIIFYGQQYEGDGFFFCCDKSGSMKDEAKFQKLKREVLKNISQFSEKVQFGIVFFDANVYKFPQSGRPAEAYPAMKTAATAYVTSQQAEVGTCSKPALKAMFDFARNSTSKRKLGIYLSDGHQTCPGFDETTYGVETLVASLGYNTERIKVNSICLGETDINETWMKELARIHNGQYARVRN